MEETPQVKAARLSKELALMINGGEDGFTWARAKELIQELVTKVDEFKDVRGQDVLEGIEKIKAAQVALANAIRSSKRGIYVPGLGDEGRKFSILKTVVLTKMVGFDDQAAWEKQDAGFEFEVMKAAREKASQNASDFAAGGAFIPDQVIADVIMSIYTRSVWVDLTGDSGETNISVVDGLVGGTVTVPKFKGGMVAYWIGEEDEYAEKTAATGVVTMNPKKLGILVKLTDAMKRFGAYGFEELLRRDMARAAAKKLDHTIMYGPGGAHSPRGIINIDGVKFYDTATRTVYATKAAMLAAVSDMTSADLTFDSVDDMQLALEEADIEESAARRIISAPRAFSWLRQLKTLNFTGQTSGQPYLLGAPMISAARLQEMIGQYRKTTQIPTTNLPGASAGVPTTSAVAKHTDVFLGEMSEIVLGRWGGIEVEDDGGRGKGFTSDHTYVKLRTYLDLGYRHAESLIVTPNAKVRA